jgi:hypothetical protein
MSAGECFCSAVEFGAMVAHLARQIKPDDSFRNVPPELRDYVVPEVPDHMPSYLSAEPPNQSFQYRRRYFTRKRFVLFDKEFLVWEER